MRDRLWKRNSAERLMNCEQSQVVSIQEYLERRMDGRITSFELLVKDGFYQTDQKFFFQVLTALINDIPQMTDEQEERLLTQCDRVSASL